MAVVIIWISVHPRRFSAAQYTGESELEFCLELKKSDSKRPPLTKDRSSLSLWAFIETQMTLFSECLLNARIIV